MKPRFAMAISFRAAVVGLTIILTSTLANPSNDDCWNAIEITEFGSIPHAAYFLADLDGATSDEITGQTYPGDDLPGVWFKTKQLSNTKREGVVPCASFFCFANTPQPQFGINYFAGSSCDSLVHMKQITYQDGDCDILRVRDPPVTDQCGDIYIRIYDTTAAKPVLQLSYLSINDEHRENPSFSTPCGLERNRNICTDLWPSKGPDWLGPVEGFVEAVQYQGAVCNGLATGYIPCNANICDVSAYQYWAVHLTAGVTYSIGIGRVDCRLDAVMQLSRGLRTEEPTHCIADESSPGFLVFADDENSMTVGCESIPGAAYGDPYISFTPEQDGIYTITVGNWMTTNVCNDEGAFEYNLYVDPPSEPVECASIFGDPVITSSPTNAPTPELVLGASSLQNSGAVSLSPSDSPSDPPSTPPTQSVSPSMGSTYSETASPTPREGIDGNCDDDFFASFSVFPTREPKRCTWLIPRNNSMIVPTIDGSFPNVTAEELLAHNINDVDEFGNMTWGDLLCKPGGAARRACEETCNTCQDPCIDDDSQYFQDNNGGYRNCLWLRQGNPRNHNVYCRSGQAPAATICYETCETCELQPGLSGGLNKPEGGKPGRRVLYDEDEELIPIMPF